MSYNLKDIAIMNSRLKKLKKEAKNSNLTYKIDQIIKGTAGYYIIFANRLIFKSVKFNNEALDDISEVIKGNISLTNTNYFTQTNIKDIKNDISTIEIINLYPEYRGIRTAKDGSGNDIIVGVKPDSFDDITNSVFNEDKVYIKKVNHLYNKDDSIHLLNTISGQVSEAELEMLAKFLNTPTLDIDDHINTDFINDNYETTSDLIAYKNIELYEDPIVYGDYTYKQYKITDINDTDYFLVYQIKNSNKEDIKTVYLENAYAFIDPLMGLGLLICNYKRIKYPDSNYKTIVIDNEGNICEHIMTRITSTPFSNNYFNQFSITYNGTTVYKIYRMGMSSSAFKPSCIYTNNEYQFIPITISNNINYILFINPKLIENITSYSEKETTFVYSDSNGKSSTSKFNNISYKNRSQLLRFQLGLQIPNAPSLYLIYCLNKTAINETTLQNGFVKSTVPGKFTTFARTEGTVPSYCAWTQDSSSFNSGKTSFKAYVFDDTSTYIHECTFNSIESAIYDTTHYIRQYKATVTIFSASETLTLYSIIYNNITYRVGVTGYMMYYPSGDGVVHVLRRNLVDDPEYTSKVSVYYLRSGNIINEHKFKRNFTVQVDSVFKYAFIQHDCNYIDFNNAGYDDPSEADEGHTKTKLEYIAYRYVGTDAYTLYRRDSGLSYRIGVDKDNGVVFFYNRYSNWLHCIYQGGIETINVDVQNITSIYDGLPSGQTAYRVKWTYMNKSYDMICIYNSKDELISSEALPTLYPFTIGGSTFYASTAYEPIYKISSTIFKKCTDVEYIDISDVYNTSTSGDKYIVKWDKQNNTSYIHRGIMTFQTNGNFSSFNNNIICSDPVVIKLIPNTGGILSSYRTKFKAVVCESHFKNNRSLSSGNYFYFLDGSSNIEYASQYGGNVEDLTTSHYVEGFNNSVDVHQWYFYISGVEYTLLEYYVKGTSNWDLFKPARSASSGLTDFTFISSSSGGNPVARFYTFSQRSFGPPINSTQSQTIYGIMIQPENYNVTEVRIYYDGEYARVYGGESQYQIYSYHQDIFSTCIKFGTV